MEAKVRQQIGFSLNQWGDFESAETQLLRSLEILRGLPDVPPEELARSVNILAGIYYDRRAFDKAEPLYREVLELAPKFSVGQNRWILGSALNDVGMTLLHKGEAQGAMEFLWQAREVYTNVFGPTHRFTLQASANLADCLADLGEDAEAISWHERILSLRRQTLGDHVHVARSLGSIGELHMKSGRAAEAEGVLREAAEIFRRLSGAEHAHYGRALTKLGQAIAALDRLPEAETVLRESLSICRLKLSPDEPDVREAVEALCDVLERQNKPDEARQLRTELQVSGR